jgi:hypothetical protein
MPALVDGLIIDFGNERVKKDFLSRLAKIPPAKYEITVKKYSGRKSNQQMRYYRGFIVRPLYDFMREQGDPHNAEYWHKHLAGLFLSIDTYHPLTGEYMGQVVRSTTELNIPEFSEYIDIAGAYVADSTGLPIQTANLHLGEAYRREWNDKERKQTERRGYPVGLSNYPNRNRGRQDPGYIGTD